MRLEVNIKYNKFLIIDLINSIQYYIDMKRIKLKYFQYYKFKRKIEFIYSSKFSFQDISNIIENKIKFNDIYNIYNNIIKIYE